MFRPTSLGKLFRVKHRVVLAPLTRQRASEPGLAPRDMHVEYYKQRASEGGLLISEATHISPESLAYVSTPGIFTLEQVKAWKKVTDAVHEKKGLIFCQLWHTGRCAATENGSFAKHPLVETYGRVPAVSSSALPIEYPDRRKGGKKLGKTATYEGLSKYAPARQLSKSDIGRLVDDYRHAAQNAIQVSRWKDKLLAARKKFTNQQAHAQRPPPWT